MKLSSFILNCFIFESSVDGGIPSLAAAPFAALKSARATSGSLSNPRESERFDS